MIVLRFSAILLALLALGTAALAQPHATEPAGVTGTIDWTAMTARATGTGTPPNSVADPARANAMAERAAILDARRNLLEVIGQVRIDSRTTVRDFITQSDEVKTTVRGMLRGSNVLRTAPRGDGSWTALVSVPLTGELSRAVLSAPVPQPHTVQTAPAQAAPQPDQTGQRVSALEQRLANLERYIAALEQQNRAQDAQNKLLAQQLTQSNQRAGQPAQQPVAPPQPDPNTLQELAELRAAQTELAGRIRELEERPASPQTATEQPASAPAPPPGPVVTKVPRATPVPVPTVPDYSGIVLDVRGLGFTPSLRPTISAPDGTALYPPQNAAADIAAKGAVRYFRDLSQAQRSDRAGTKPLTIKATGLTPDGSPMLSPADAALLGAMAATADNPVEKLNMVVVF